MKKTFKESSYEVFPNSDKDLVSMVKSEIKRFKDGSINFFFFLNLRHANSFATWMIVPRQQINSLMRYNTERVRGSASEATEKGLFCSLSVSWPLSSVLSYYHPVLQNAEIMCTT